MDFFYIFLTFDIDQDFNPNNSDYYNRSKADFSSFFSGFENMVDRLDYKPYSLFLRADYQIFKTYGAYDFLLSENPKLINKIENQKSEINWHIHIYNNSDGNWNLAKTSSQITDLFLNDYENIKKICDINSNIIRIGECLMNNELMNLLDSLGIKIDSTALPGRKRNDIEKFFDWEKTNNNIYYPSKEDYRISGENKLSIIEAPMTTLLIKAEYDIEPIYRYFNLSFKSSALFYSFEEHLSKHNFLISITHPFEVIGKGNHGLISFSMDTFLKNINILIEKVKSQGKIPVFCKISDLLNENYISKLF